MVELHVECREIDEVEVFGALEAGHAVNQREGVGAHAVAGVAVWQWGRGGSLEGFERVLGGETLQQRA